MKKFITSILLFIMVLCLCAGCKKREKEQEIAIIPIEREPSEKPTLVIEEKEEDLNAPEGMAKSKLTGLWIDKELANKRPYAMMINNIAVVNPQSGISEADILYEAIVEGGITRLMGIFQNFSSERIGSIRSARHYYASFADEYDAIFVHFGETKYATSKLRALGIDNLSGLEGVGNIVFYRDNAIASPHNVFTSYKGIMAGMEQKGYRAEYKEGYKGHFTFYEEDTTLESTKIANKVTLKFSSYAQPYFEYNKEENLYKRYQFGGSHIDKNTGEQLSFKNIIVQYVREWNIDKKGYQTMDLENTEGQGYYISNGKIIDITWKKNEVDHFMRYYDKDGKELSINSGKTYIAIFPNDRMADVVISEGE